MNCIDFVVPGVPVPKARPRLGKHGAYTPAKTKLYERSVSYYAREAMRGIAPLECAVRVDLEIYMPIPESFNKLKRERAIDGKLRPIGKIDLDNMAKALLDGQNKIVYVDDNQVCDLSASKYYAEYPRVEIKVSWDE